MDNLHEMSQNAVKSALLALISNLNVIRDWLLNHGGVDESENTAAEPAPAAEESQD